MPRRGKVMFVPEETERAIRRKRPRMAEAPLSYAVLCLVHEALGIAAPPTPGERKAAARKRAWADARGKGRGRKTAKT
jgi:hypothetical protein